MQVTETDWTAEAVRLRRDEEMATAEIAERVGRSASQVRRVLAAANTERAINGRPRSNGDGPHAMVWHGLDVNMSEFAEFIGRGPDGRIVAQTVLLPTPIENEFVQAKPGDTVTRVGDDMFDVKRPNGETAKIERRGPIPGQTTVDDHLPPSSREGLVGELDECDKCGQLEPLTYVPEYGANFCETCAADPQATGSLNDVPPEDDPEHPDTLAGFRGEAGEAVGPMPPREMDGGDVVVETRLAGTRQMALDFGENADVPVGGTLIIKSDKLASGFYGLGDIITGTFTARVVDVAGKERLQRASEEFRAQPQHHVALITELTVGGAG